jgi:hypothetical protein
MRMFSLDFDSVLAGTGGGSNSSALSLGLTAPASSATAASMRPTTAPVGGGLSRLRPPSSSALMGDSSASVSASLSSSSAAPSSTAFGDRMQRVIFKALESAVEEERIDAMKEIWSGVAEKGAQIVQPHTDKVVASLLAQVLPAFLSPSLPSFSRRLLCFFLLLCSALPCV